jgi:phosphatidylinositol-3,4,5-trisphosphate 5-phosphatase 2
VLKLQQAHSLVLQISKGMSPQQTMALIDQGSSPLRIFCGTFNVGETSGIVDLSPWFACAGPTPCDIYAIGIQEAAGPDREWAESVTESLSTFVREPFALISKAILWKIRLAVFVRVRDLHRISNVRSDSVGTGIANMLGNKGGVAVSFDMDQTSFCFVGCHLASGTEHCTRRNDDFSDIMRRMVIDRQARGADMAALFHHVIWLGDLNYRCEAPIDNVLCMIDERNWQKLLGADQLLRERQNGRAFHGFQEKSIGFAPTYRLVRNQPASSPIYSWEKQYSNGKVRINQPSWCDRVLWKSLPHLESIALTYGSCANITVSDHLPVFAVLECHPSPQRAVDCDVIDGCVVPRPLLTNRRGVVAFRQLKCSISIPRAESADVAPMAFVEAAFLMSELTWIMSASVDAECSRSPRGDTDNFLVTAVWSTEHMPFIAPDLPSIDYLTRGHLILLFKSSRTLTVLGQSVLSLLPLSGSLGPVPAWADITRYGVHVGQSELEWELLESSIS